MLRRILLGVALVLLWAGCGEDKRPRPPNERNRMVLEFFEAMRLDRADEAVRQAERLQAVVPDSDFLRVAAETQKANAVIRKMNALLGEGKLQEASQLLDGALMDSPFNEQLKRCAADMAKLSALDRALRDLDPALPSEEQRLRIARVKDALAPYPKTKEWKHLVAVAERNLACKIRAESRDWRFFCDGVLKELDAEETPDAELRSTVRILRSMGSAL